MTDEVEPEFVQLFAEDALVKLDKMGEQLLELESASNPKSLLADLGRDAHSLKGAAGMVGLTDFADVCHALEDPLQRLRNGKAKASPELVDKLLAGIDGLRVLLAQSKSSDGASKSSALARSLVAQLQDGSTPALAPEPAPARPIPQERPSEPAPESMNGSATMQVAVQRLDQIDRLVSESAAAHLRVGLLLAEDFNSDPESIPQYRELARLLGRLQEVTMRARMVPLATIAPSLHRAVRDIAHATNKKVRWEVEGEETEIDRKVLELMLDPLVHLVRNAVDHGIETPDERVAAGKPAEAVVKLHAMQHGSEIVISISDDGRGVDVAKVRAAAQKSGIDTSAMSEADIRGLIFTSGLSTAEKITEYSGRGVGLDVVRANLELVRGHIDLSTTLGKGTQFTINVPITLTIVECLVVEAASQSFAIPMQSVIYLLPADIVEQDAAGRAMVMNGEVAVPLVGLAQVLGLEGNDHGPVVVVSGGKHNLAFRVARLVGHRDMVIKGLGSLLRRNEIIAGAAIEPDGAVVIVLDFDGLIARAEHTKSESRLAIAPSAARKPSILVVDDALTVRELQRSILERSGYDVRVASNGKEAMALLLREPSDLVLTDLEMPSMDGFALTESIRKHPTLGQTPVVILTSHDSEPERQQGLAAGANAYIIKSGFDQNSLLSLVEKLLLGGSV